MYLNTLSRISMGGSVLPSAALTLRVGDHDLLELEGHERDYHIKTIYIHDKTLGHIFSTMEYDVALLEVSGDGFLLGDYVLPVCLGTRDLTEGMVIKLLYIRFSIAIIYRFHILFFE